MEGTRRAARPRSPIVVFAITAVVALVLAGGASAQAGSVDGSGGSQSFSKTGSIDGRSTTPCWEYQDTWSFGNALADQGSGTYYILWCANQAKTSVTSIPKFTCSSGPTGFWTYDGCDKHHGTLPNGRVRFTVHWYYHFSVSGVRVNKTLTVDGYVYPNGGISGSASCC
jgi:hypothetical protein